MKVGKKIFCIFVGVKLLMFVIYFEFNEIVVIDKEISWSKICSRRLDKQIITNLIFKRAPCKIL